MSRGKSTLKSFSFGSYKGVNELPDEVVVLFTTMVERPEKSVEFAEEIINAGLEGRINLDRKFNLGAYEYIIRNNIRMNDQDRQKKETFFSDDNFEDPYKGGVSENKVSDERDDYALLEDEDEVKWAVNSIKANNDSYRVDYGINLIKLLKKGAEGYPQAVERLTSVCKEFERVGEWIKIILSSGHPVASLFSDDGVVFSVVSDSRDNYTVAEKAVAKEVSKVVTEAEVIEVVSDDEKEITREVVEFKANNTTVVDIREMFKKSSNSELNGVSVIEEVAKEEVVADVNGVLSYSDDKLIVYSEDDLNLAVNKFNAYNYSLWQIYEENRSELLKRSDSRYLQSSEKLRDIGDKYKPVSQGTDNSHPIVLFFPDNDKVVDLSKYKRGKENISSLHRNRGVASSNRCRAVNNRAIPMKWRRDLQTYSSSG